MVSTGPRSERWIGSTSSHLGLCHMTVVLDVHLGCDGVSD